MNFEEVYDFLSEELGDYITKYKIWPIEKTNDSFIIKSLTIADPSTLSEHKLEKLCEINIKDFDYNFNVEKWHLFKLIGTTFAREIPMFLYEDKIKLSYKDTKLDYLNSENERKCFSGIIKNILNELENK